MFEVLVPLRDTPDQWYSVDAVSLRGDLYRITAVAEGAPPLRYGPGDRVVCDTETDDHGRMLLRARRIAAASVPD